MSFSPDDRRASSENNEEARSDSTPTDDRSSAEDAGGSKGNDLPGVERQHEERRWFNGIMLAVLIWGTTLSIGAFLFGLDQKSGKVHFSPNPIRGLITLGFVLAFLWFWRTLLKSRSRVTIVLCQLAIAVF